MATKWPRGARRAVNLLLVLILCLAAVWPGVASAAPKDPNGKGDDEVRLFEPDDAKVPPDAPVRVAGIVTGDYRVDSLVSGYSWGSLNPITYSFYSNSVFGGEYYGSEAVSEVSAPVKTSVRQIMAWYGKLINRNIVEVTETSKTIGHIRFMLSTAPSYAYAYYPSGTAMFSVAGDVHLNPSYDNTSSTNGWQTPPGQHGYMSMVHEIGHALGLKHPFDGSPVLPVSEDNTSNTVMTYTFTGRSSATPMVYDVMALQHIYGVRANNTGDDTYAFTSLGLYQYNLAGKLYLSPTNATKQTLWDTAGANTLDFSALPSTASGYRLDLNPGGWLTAANAIATTSAGSVYYDSGASVGPSVQVHNVVGSKYADTFYANAQANTFAGYAPARVTGADVIYDADGADTVDLSAYIASAVGQTRDGNDHLLSLGATNGSIRLKDYYLGKQPRLLLGGGLPALSVGDVTVQEPASGSVAAVFTVSLSAAPSETVTLNYATASGSASGGLDYVQNSGSLTFAVGGTLAKTISVAVLADSVDENAETFYLQLSQLSGAVAGRLQGVGTIEDWQNQAPTASFTATPLTGSAPLAVTFNGSASSDADGSIVSYTWDFGDGTGATGPSASHTYGAGDFTARLTVTDNHGGTASQTRAITATAAKVEAYVSSIAVTIKAAKRGQQAVAVVTVKGDDGKMIANAKVTGRWSGIITGNANATTGSDGTATLTSKATTKSGTATFTVTGVTVPAGYVYVPDRSVTTASTSMPN